MIIQRCFIRCAIASIYKLNIILKNKQMINWVASYLSEKSQLLSHNKVSSSCIIYLFFCFTYKILQATYAAQAGVEAAFLHMYRDFRHQRRRRGDGNTNSIKHKYTSNLYWFDCRTLFKVKIWRGDLLDFWGKRSI